MVNQLPTKPGHYHWREKDGDEWEVREVCRGFDGELYFETVNIAGKSVEELGGQWSPIPTPDEGIEAFAVFTPSGIPLVNTVALARQQSINRHAMSKSDTWSKREEMGYTVQPVIVFKREVVG